MAFAGRLRHVLMLTAPDDTEHKFRAAVRGANATESEVAGLDTGVVGYSIRIRQSPNGARPGPRWTTMFRGRKLLVQGSYDPTGKGRELVLIALEPS